MGVLDTIFGNSDLKCAVGLAATPFVGVFGASACSDLVEEVLSPIPTQILQRVETCPPGIPPETCERLFKSVRVFEKTNLHALERLEQAQDLLQEAAKALLFGPTLYPIVVGLERFGCPLIPSTESVIPDLGSFAADLLMSSAMFGVASLGALAIAKHGVEAVKTRVLQEYVKQIPPMYFHPLF